MDFVVVKVRKTSFGIAWPILDVMKFDVTSRGTACSSDEHVSRLYVSFIVRNTKNSNPMQVPQIGQCSPFCPAFNARSNNSFPARLNPECGDF